MQGRLPRDSPWGMASALPGMAVGFRTDVAAAARPSDTALPLRTGAFLLRSAPPYAKASEDKPSYAGQGRPPATEGGRRVAYHGPFPPFFLHRSCISDEWGWLRRPTAVASTNTGKRRKPPHINPGRVVCAWLLVRPGVTISAGSFGTNRSHFLRTLGAQCFSLRT